MKNDFIEFVNECRKNRLYLGLTSKDMANCLIDVSEDNYNDFEDGKYGMSKENIERLVRVLCVSKPKDFDINKYLDVSELNKEEVNDLTEIVKVIVGEEND